MHVSSNFPFCNSVDIFCLKFTLHFFHFCPLKCYLPFILAPNSSAFLPFSFLCSSAFISLSLLFNPFSSPAFMWLYSTLDGCSRLLCITPKSKAFWDFQSLATSLPTLVSFHIIPVMLRSLLSHKYIPGTFLPSWSNHSAHGKGEVKSITRCFKTLKILIFENIMCSDWVSLHHSIVCLIYLCLAEITKIMILVSLHPISHLPPPHLFPQEEAEFEQNLSSNRK